jgi:hypothetical protein
MLGPLHAGARDVAFALALGSSSHSDPGGQRQPRSTFFPVFARVEPAMVLLNATGSAEEGVLRRRARLELRAELAPSIVKRLIDGAARAPKPRRDEFDRCALHRDSHKHVALPVSQHLLNRTLERMQQLELLDPLLGTGNAEGKQPPPVWVNRKLPSLPDASSERRSRLENGKLARPGGEAARALELLHVGKNQDERIVRRLGCHIVDPLAAELLTRCTTGELEARRTEQQRVEPLRRRFAGRALAAKCIDPGAGIGIQARAHAHGLTAPIPAMGKGARFERRALPSILPEVTARGREKPRADSATPEIPNPPSAFPISIDLPWSLRTRS